MTLDQTVPSATRNNFSLRILRTGLVVTWVLFCTLILLEVVIRVWGYAERHIYDPIYTSFDRTPDIPYIHKPNLTDARGRGLVIISTDSLGLRSVVGGVRSYPKQEQEFRIAIVSDSVTFGEGVPNTQDTFAQVLEDTLNQRQQSLKVTVFNYGASAYSVKQMAATLEYRMVDIKPDLVVMAIIPSDFNLDRTPTVDTTGYLIDKGLIPLFPPDTWIRQVLRPIRLSYLIKDVGYQWFFTRQDMRESLARGEVPDSYTFLQHFKDTAARHSLPYLIVLLPSDREGVWDHVAQRLRADGLTYVDLSSLRKEFTPERYRASRFDVHPSRFTGESVKL